MREKQWSSPRRLGSAVVLSGGGKEGSSKVEPTTRVCRRGDARRSKHSSGSSGGFVKHGYHAQDSGPRSSPVMHCQVAASF